MADVTITNTFSPNTKIKSSEVNTDLTDLKTAIDTKPKTVDRQDNTTNNTIGSPHICTGWGWILGDDAQVYANEVVTLPITYDSKPVILVAPLGNVGSDPSDIGDFTNEYQVAMSAQASDITTSTFKINLVGLAVMGSTSRHGYSWIAIGTKA